MLGGMSEPRRGIVWILGAGFSRYLGAPLLNELLTDESLARVRAIYRDQPKVLSELRNAHGITKFFSWGKTDNRSYWHDAEEFLERLDHAAEDPVQARVLSVPLREFYEPFTEEISQEALREEVRTGFNKRLFREEGIADLRLQALKLAAAEVSGFLEGADPKLERWAPYRAWAESLDHTDTVLTFNYDLVLETLNSLLNNKLRFFGFNPPQSGGPFGPGVSVAKMHGSVDWYLQDPQGRGSWDTIRRMSGTIVTASVFEKKMAIATPGPRKKELIHGAFKQHWDHAETAIAQAEALVFCGYRMPPTDAGTKQWLVDAVRQWAANNENNQSPLFVHIVLGPTPGADAIRLVGLLKSVEPRITTVTWPLGAEDFLGLFGRSELLRPREKIPPFATVT